MLITYGHFTPELPDQVYVLPKPVVSIRNKAPVTGLGQDGNSIDVAFNMHVTFLDVHPDLIADPQYDLGLELLRYKTRIRKEMSVSYNDKGWVHSVNSGGGNTVSPVLIGTSRGNPNYAGGTATPTEWLLVGSVTRSLELQGEKVIAPWFNFRRIEGRDIAGTPIVIKYPTYATGRASGRGPLGNLGVQRFFPTGIFGFRLSYWDPINSIRVTGPTSSHIVVRPHVSLMADLSTTGNLNPGQLAFLNPLYNGSDYGGLIAFIDDKGYNRL